MLHQLLLYEIGHQPRLLNSVSDVEEVSSWFCAARCSLGATPGSVHLPVKCFQTADSQQNYHHGERVEEKNKEDHKSWKFFGSQLHPIPET